MALNRNQVRPDRLRRATSSIKFLTENGFSIVRLSEIDPAMIDSPGEGRFLVEHEGEKLLRAKRSTGRQGIES